MDRTMSEGLDRHITGNYGEDQIEGETMAHTIEVNILRHDAENWLGDTENVNVDSTVEAYADRADEALSSVFPGAVVTVTVLPRTELSTRCAIVVDGETDGFDVETVGAILTDVLNGRHGEYIVTAEDLNWEKES